MSQPHNMFPSGSPAEEYYRIGPGTKVAVELEVLRVDGDAVRVKIGGTTAWITEFQKIQPYEEGQWTVYVP